MDEMTLGIIYALKDSEKDLSYKDKLIDYMSKITESKKSAYTDEIIYKLTVNAFIDYLRTADNPSFDVWRYFESKSFHNNETDCILSTLSLTKVRDNGKYVNGFRALERNTT